MRIVLFSLVLMILSLAPGALGATNPGDFAFRPHPGAHLPLNLDFVDEQGQMVSLRQFFTGAPVVLVLDYLRCRTLCGLTLDQLVGGLDALPLVAGRDVQVVVISIDPRDQPADVEAAKVKYLAAYHHSSGNGGWHFLVGRPSTVRQVADVIGFPYRYEAALDQYIHPAGFVVVARDGTVSRYLLGIGTQARDLRQALADAAQGKTVGWMTRLLLLCHGDTPPGRYSLPIEGAFVAANLTVIIGGIVAFVAIRRRWHG